MRGALRTVNKAEVAVPIATRQGQGPRHLASAGQAWRPFAVHDALLCHVASAVVLSHDLASRL
jgi:hypothetical protein